MRYRFMAISVAGVVAACGPRLEDGPDGADDSGGVAPGATSSNAEAGGAGSSAGGSANAAGGEWPDPPELLDLSESPESFVACSDEPAILDVRSAATPQGAQMIVGAYASYDFCSNAVYISLVPEDMPVASDLIFLIDREGDFGTMYAGTYHTKQGGLGAPGGADVVTFVQPWDASEAFDAEANPTLEIRLELHVEGWDVSADLTVPFCAERGMCFCPCE